MIQRLYKWILPIRTITLLHTIEWSPEDSKMWAAFNNRLVRLHGWQMSEPVRYVNDG